MPQVLVKDVDQADGLIQERKRIGADRYDEVWDGVYVMPSMPSLEHQEQVQDLCMIFGEVVKRPGLGQVYPGANVSDRGADWKTNFRVPDVVIVLRENTRAVSHPAHIQGGPDFLVEIESPGDDSEEKVPFYAQIGVRELLLVHRDRRTLRLLRLQGQELVLVPDSLLEGKRWLVSEVLPLAFRRKVQGGKPVMEIRRTDGQPGQWIV
jgi:Uma2 family endonuclease